MAFAANCNLMTTDYKYGEHGVVNHKSPGTYSLLLTQNYLIC